MLGLSTADGFMSVKEGIDVMIKYLANEPSVGLYYVQQHAQASMPHLLDVKEGVMEKVNEVTLHTEDAEDSIDVVRTMTEIGYPLAEEMIKDIKASLQIMSKGKPKRGLLRGHQTDNVSKVGSRGYLSAVFSSAKQGTAGFRWPLTVLPSEANQPSQSSSRSGFRSDASDQSFAESEELPLSSSLELDEKPLTSSSSRDAHDPELVYPIEDYNRFKFEKEAKFEAWLHDSEVRCKSHKTGDL